MRWGGREEGGAGSLLNRDFVLLWQGQLVSQMGNQAFLVAMMFWAMEATGSAAVVGLLLTLSTLPGVVLGPVAGTFVDRHSRRTVIIVADAARGIAVLALAAVSWLRPEATGLILATLFGVAAFGGIAGSVFNPAIAAAIPDMVPRARVASANSLNQLSAQGATFLGQAVGGVLYRLLGAPLLFLVDGLSYLFSSASECFIRIPQRLPDRSESVAAALRTYWSETAAGFRYLVDDPGRRSFLGVAAGLNFLFMPIFVLLPFYVTDVLGQRADWYGFLLAGLSAGSLVGLAAAGALELRGPARGRLLLASLLATAGGMAALGLVRQAPLALAVLALLGALTALINILVMTLFQVSTPGPMRGRVMALVIALSGAATPLGMAAGGVLGDATGRDIPLVYTACGALALVWTALAATRAPVRTFLMTDHPPAA